MKFFPMAIGESQKAQIHDSFTTTRKSDQFKAKTWTLCIPIDMSLDEKKWFDTWKDSQTSSGIEINLWSGTHLEGILFDKKNEGIKEEFFKEEYLTQIRDSHQMLLLLLEQLSPLVLTPILQPIRPLKARCLAEEGVPRVVEMWGAPADIFTRRRVGIQSLVLGPRTPGSSSESV